MRSLDIARQVCERYHPGLCDALDQLPLMEREAPNGTVIDLFSKFDGVGLLVPKQFGGAAADPVDAVRVMQGLSSYSPSLGAGVCMHHFTVAMLYALAGLADRLTDAQRDVLSKVVSNRTLMASGWSEGRPGQNILVPTMIATRSGGDWLLSGSKKPCSLSRSMELLTASVIVTDDGEPRLGLALVPSDSPGLSVKPFWNTPIMAGAQSDEVVLDRVRIPDDLMIRSQPDDPHRLDDLQTAGFIWFVLLITSVYVGAASALAAEVLSSGRGSVTDRASVMFEVEAAVRQLEGVAHSVASGLSGDEAVAAVLVTRYSIQSALMRAAELGVELLGGMSYMRSFDPGYLFAALRLLAFHPPSRTSAAAPLLDFFAGGPLQLA